MSDIAFSAIANRGDLDARFRELVVSIADHGASTSASDNADAFDAAHTKALAIGGAVYIPPGTWSFSRTLRVDAVGGIYGAGRLLSTIQPTAGFSGSALIQFGANEAGSARGNAVVGGFKILGQGTGVDGVVVYKAQNLDLFDIWANQCRHGIFCDGQYNIRVLALLMRNVRTQFCTTGFRFEAPDPQTTSFDSFTLLNCTSEQDATGVYVSGALRNHVSMIGGEVQASTVAGVHSVGGYVRLLGTYIETADAGTIPSVKAESGAVVVADASVNIAYPSVDATSTVIAQGGVTSAYRWMGSQWIGARDGEADGLGWGPPNWPLGKPGFQSARGQAYLDSQGVEWTCTKDGVTTGTKPRFCALGGEIRIPLSYTAITNGAAHWFPQEDFVMTDIDVFVTETFTGGTFIKLGDGIQQDNYISQTQGAVANLVAGARLSARRNKTTTAHLAPPSRGHGIAGADSVGVSNAVRTYLSGTFTAGALLIVIRGYYLLGGIRGTVTDEATGRPASALVQTYATADRTLGAYTPDVESTVYTGAADGEAKLSDLNALRLAYENLRAFVEDLAQHHNALVDDLQAQGIEP